MLYYFFIGSLLGLSAGLSAGPLLALLLSETIRHGNKAGVKVALAPLVTDLPIIGFAVFVLANVSDSRPVLAVLSFCGAAFVAWMGVDNLRCSATMTESEKEQPKSIAKGVVTNLLSPHPYLFWLTVGVPLMNRARRDSYAQAIIFVLSFYVLLVGSKVSLALLAGKSRGFLSGKIYTYMLRTLGGLLCLFSAILVVEGIKILINP
ncbi:MAG: LysE family translocator [Desulfocapsaceae bacterium]|nr:LysE family translocator [Desulfocapsaceae bacterium]